MFILCEVDGCGYGNIVSSRATSAPTAAQTGEPEQHPDAGLAEVKAVVAVFRHLFGAGDADGFAVAEPQAIQHQRVVPVHDEPDQIAVPKSFPEALRTVELPQNHSGDQGKNKGGSALAQQVLFGEAAAAGGENSQLCTALADGGRVVPDGGRGFLRVKGTMRAVNTRQSTAPSSRISMLFPPVRVMLL